MLFGALGNFETPSATPVACNCGVFAADNARCIAAADGCDELGLDSGCGRLSFRIGDVLREVLGLADGLCWTQLFEGCFFNIDGAELTDVVDEDIAISSLSLLDTAAGSVLSTDGVAASPFTTSGSGLLLAMLRQAAQTRSRNRMATQP